MAPEFSHPSETLQTAAVLIDYVPKLERPAFFSSLIRSLRASNPAGLSFTAALVASEADQDVKEEFLSVLDHLLRNGHVDAVISVGSQYPAFGNEVLSRAVVAVRQAKSALVADGIDVESIQPYLKLSRSITSQLSFSDTQAELLGICLEMLSDTDRDTSKNALEVVFVFLSRSDDSRTKEFVGSRRQKIWETIRKLATSSSNIHNIDGYSLWLRYILATPAKTWSGLVNPEYWDLLLRGLRHGDSERRKLCLNIIKLSIAADADAVSSDVRHPLERYCVVFETIVLGRYINQIQECDKDLDAIANSKTLEDRWFYVLLASGLDTQMQDSNRKFIGNWIMRSNIELMPEFLEFFRSDFLPWAIQGQLFVSSLKSVNGVLRCVHGDALVNFIKRLRKKDSTDLVDAIVHLIHRKYNTIFAYAVVYLLEGIADLLQPKHMTQIAEVKALPEVARDYVKSKTSTMSDATMSKTHSRRVVTEQAAIAKCRAIGNDISTLDDIWPDLEYLEYSKRLLMTLPRTMLNPAMVQSAVQDRDVGANLTEKLRTLQTVSSTKIFLLSPLIRAVWEAVLTNPHAASALLVTDFIIRVAQQPPEPTIDLMLEEATIHLAGYSYEDFFGDRPSRGFAAILDLVSRLSNHQDLIEVIWDHILHRWKSQKVPPPTVSAWKNTLQLQVLLLVVEQYEPESTAKIDALLGDLLHILSIEPLPRYRYLLEATVVRLVVRYDSGATIIERLNTKDHHSNPKHLASLMKIGTILACRKESKISFAMQLAASFVPLAASSKVVIRHEAQWQVPVLMDHCRAREWTSITENPAYASLDSYIRSLERFSDPPLERQIGAFDPETDFTMSNLIEGRWFGLDQHEAPLTSYDDFVNLYKDGLPPGAPESCIPLGTKITRIPTPQQDSSNESTNANSSLGPRTATESSALQTKGTAYLARTLSDPNSHGTRPHPIIVVGSLVDNPYNLGGLSRVSEIFGAAALTLQNQNVLSNKDFTSVSVSSHLHFPIVQLSAPNVPSFLAERKKEGYSVVGIEQTNRSVQLGSEKCVLPRKVVLVVGSEKEGIPGVVLTECDTLVEIPQAGVTRSLNVQTAVGVVLFEYARQHRQ